MSQAKMAEKSEEDRRRDVRAVCRKFLKDGPVDEWTPAKVAQFLDACNKESLLGAGQSASGVSLADTFRKHGVRGRQLALLDGFTGNQKLKEPPFSIASLGQRLKLLDALKVLVEEDVEARTGAANPGARTESDGKSHPARASSRSGGVAEMLGRTCPRAASSRGAPGTSELMATVPAWRSTAFPPSGWVDPGEAGRTVPSTELDLEFVFGYSGSRARGNLSCNASGEIIFPASHIVVVFNIETRTQRFFLEHTDEVSAIAMHPEKVIVATGEHGREGKVYVWDSQSMETLAVLTRSVPSSAQGDAPSLGVSSLSFADNPLITKGDGGDLLVAVTEDMLVMVWLWKERELITHASAGTGCVYAARANLFKSRQNLTVVTAGTQSVRFWTLKGQEAKERAGRSTTNVSLLGVYGSVGDIGLQQAAVSIEFLDSMTTVTGMQDGSIYVWNGIKVSKSLDPAHAGPIFDLAVKDNYLLSAAHDGKVHQWSLTKPNPERARTVLTLLGTIDTDELCRKMDAAHELRQAPAAHTKAHDGKENSVGSQPRGRGHSDTYSYWDHRTPCARALSILPSDETGRTCIAMGLETNSIYLLVNEGATFGMQAECRSLLNGHAQDHVTCLCSHSNLGLLASVGSDSTVRVWDLRSKRMVSQHRLWERTPKGQTRALTAACVDMSSDAEAHLCVGLTNGCCKILSCKSGLFLHETIAPGGWGANGGGQGASQSVSVTCVKYSPQDNMLAVALTDNTIAVYFKSLSGYEVKRLISVSLGGFVCKMDWSLDGHYLQGATNSQDLIYWEVERKGRQVRNMSQLRDVHWHTSSCTIGWSVRGLHPEAGSTEYEINAVARVGKEVVIAGTSSGEVFVSRYPSLDDTKLKRIRAHVAGVSAVCFTPAGAVGGVKRDTIFTAGGNELTIFCWRVRRLRTEVDTDTLSMLNKQRDNDMRQLLALLPCHGVSAQAAEQTSLFQASEPWRSSMLRPPLDVKHLSPDLVGGWGSSFSRMTLKDLDILLDHVHGYRGHDCRGNILSTRDGLVVWFVGRVVVLSVGGGRQRFYLQHGADVACIAKFESSARAQDDEDAGEESHVLMATAEVGDVGQVHVWDTQSLAWKVKLVHGFAVRRLSFGPEGKMLVTAGGHVDVRTLTVWDWAAEVQLAHLTCDHNVPFLDMMCNQFYVWQGDIKDQMWAATCGPHGVTFWTLHEPEEGGKHKLTIEEGGLHHASDHLPDPMAMCGHFVSSSILVTGMANGDLITWRGEHSTNRIRLAHPRGVFDIAGNSTTMITGGMDCVVKIWDIFAFKGSSMPESRAIPCKAMLQDRTACIRSVCIGEGIREGKLYVGLASNDMLEVSSSDSSDYSKFNQGHTPRPEGLIESREWVFTFPDSSASVYACLKTLKDVAGYLIYRQMPVGSRVAAASSTKHSTSASTSVSAWHSKSATQDSTNAPMQGFVQFKSALPKARVCHLLPGATVELAAPKIRARTSGGIHVHLASLTQPGPNAPTICGVLEESKTSSLSHLLQNWPFVSLAAHPRGEMGASAGRDGTLRIWELPVTRRKGQEATASRSTKLKELQEDLLCIAWSHDAQAIAVGSAKGSLYVINAYDLTERFSQIGDTPAGCAALSAITATCFRPDCQYLASAGFCVIKPSASDSADGRGEYLQVSVLITFVGKKRVPGDRAEAFERIERGLLPPHKARGIPISLDWSSDGRYLQVATRHREVLYWSVLPFRALTPDFTVEGVVGTGAPGVEAGRDVTSLEAMQAWDTFESSQLSAAKDRPGFGWSSWRIPFGFALEAAFAGSHASTSAERCGYGPMYAAGDISGAVSIVTHHLQHDRESVRVAGEGEGGERVLEGIGKHSGGVASVAFARNVETHRMRLLTTGNDDLAVYEWLLKPVPAFIKRRKERAVQRIQARQRAIAARALARQEMERLQKAKEAAVAAAAEKADKGERDQAKDTGDEGATIAESNRDDEGGQRMLQTLQKNQDELAAAIQKLSSDTDPSTLQALQALISAQQQVLSLIAEHGGGEELESGGKETERTGGTY